MPVGFFNAFLLVFNFDSAHVTTVIFFPCLPIKNKLTKFNSRPLADCEIPNFKAA